MNQVTTTTDQKPLDINIEQPRVKSGLTDYISKLETHDWSFEFSDDGNVWRKGLLQLKELRQYRLRLDPDYAIWNQHCHPMFKNGGYGA